MSFTFCIKVVTLLKSLSIRASLNSLHSSSAFFLRLFIFSCKSLVIPFGVL